MRLLLPVLAALAIPVALAAQTSNVDLTVYFAKYPFDKVGSVAFLSDPSVRRAVNRAVNSGVVEKAVLDPNVTSGPIGGINGYMISHACEPHNCNRHNWTIAVREDGSSAAVCYFNAELMSEGRWFVNGQLAAKAILSDCAVRGIPRPVESALEK